MRWRNTSIRISASPVNRTEEERKVLFRQNRGGGAVTRLHLSRHLRAKRSNPSSREGNMDCFVATPPRNDDYDDRRTNPPR